MEHAEDFETKYEFGDLIMTNLVPLFERVRSDLHEKGEVNSVAQGLIEVADAISFDRKERRFYLVYTNVPSCPGGPVTTVRFRMLPQEVGILTEQMSKSLLEPEL